MLCTKEEGLSYGTVQQYIHIRTMRHIFIILMIDQSHHTNKQCCHSRFFVYHTIRTSLYVGIIIFSVQTRCKMRKRYHCAIFKEKSLIVMMHKMRLCNLVDQSRAIFHGCIRSGGRILHSLGFVFEDRPEIGMGPICQPWVRMHPSMILLIPEAGDGVENHNHWRLSSPFLFPPYFTTHWSALLNKTGGRAILKLLWHLMQCNHSTCWEG